MLHRLVTVLLNEQNQKKSDKVFPMHKAILFFQPYTRIWNLLLPISFQDTKLDVLNILANVAAGSKESCNEVSQYM